MASSRIHEACCVAGREGIAATRGVSASGRSAGAPRDSYLLGGAYRTLRLQDQEAGQPLIDASTLERRLHYCNEELRLNRRLASDLYVDVAPIGRVGGRAVIGVGGRGAIGDEPAIEYAVRMRQFDAANELPALLANNAVEAAEIAALGEALAHFHLEAPVAPWNGVGERTQHMHHAVLGNLDHLMARASLADGAMLGRLVDWTHDNAAALEPSFRLRERSGFVRECHGDLHAANIVRLGDRLTPFQYIDSMLGRCAGSMC